MKKIILIIYFFISLVNASDIKKFNNCKFIKSGNMEVGFEGYKTNFKAGVTVQFNDIVYNPGSVNAKKLSEFLLGSNVIINIKSLRTSVNLIGENLVNFFFKLLNDDQISAKILNVKPINLNRGNLSVEITMNKITKNVDMSYAERENKIFALGSINLVDFNASEALASLNKACFDMHLGKTWSDVNINFKIPIEKICKK